MPPGSVIDARGKKSDGTLGFVQPSTWPTQIPVANPFLQPGHAEPALPYFDSPTPFLKKAGGTLGTKLNTYLQVGQLLQYSWQQGFSPLLGGLGTMLLFPWGQMGLAKGVWTKGCDTMPLCTPGPGTPWTGQWTDAGPSCTVPCSTPTVEVFDWNLHGANPYLWSGNTLRIVQYGSTMPSFPPKNYFRTKQVWTAKVGTPTDRFYLYSRLTNVDPGLLPDPFPTVDATSLRAGQTRSPQPGTSPIPNIDPMLQPVWQPFPTPSPLPYAVGHPVPLDGVDASMLGETTPAVAPAPVVLPPYSPAPGVVVEPGTDGHGTVAVSPELLAQAGAAGSGSGLVTVPPSVVGGAHEWSPPKPREREQKARGGKAAAAALAYGAATETVDFIEAAWQAMGSAGGWQTKVPGQKTNPAEMVADLYHAFGDDHFDPATFWAQLPVEVAKNEVVDRGIGTIGSLGTAASRAGHGGRPVGFGFGGALGNGPMVPKEEK